MNERDLDQLLVDTLHSREPLAPHADDVLATLPARLGRRRAATPLAVAASVAVVAGAAGAAVLLTGHHTTPAAKAPAAHRSAQLTAAPQQQPADPPALTMPFDLGYLPDGQVHYDARRINLGGTGSDQNGEYLLTVTSGGRSLLVDVQQMSGGLSGVHFKSGPGEQTTIGGHPAVQSSNSAGPGGYEVYFDDATGGLIYVNTAADPGSTATAAELTQIGREVAAHVDFPGTTQVTPSFGLGDLPAGVTRTAFDVGDYTTYDLDDSGQWITVGQTMIPLSGGDSGRDVQGHPTRVLDEDGYRSLQITDAVHGDAVLLAGRVSFDELYRLADGLELPTGP